MAQGNKKTIATEEWVATEITDTKNDITTDRAADIAAINHNDLQSRQAADAHGIDSITGLRTEVDKIYVHPNVDTLDKFGEDGGGLPTYNGNAIDTTIAQRDVYDALDSTDNTISLSAKQGKVLKDLIDNAGGGDTTPIGIISLWSGSVTNIPTDWALCDGLNGTPDLREKFVMGVTDDAGVNNVGGSKDAVVISHNHSGSSGNQSNNHYHANDHNHDAAYTSSDNHNHNNGTTGGGLAAVYGQESVTEQAGKVSSTSNATSVANLTSSDSHYHSLNLPEYSGYTGYVSHSHTHTITVNANGVVGTDKNLPPYMKLAYIMKVA